MHNDDLQIGRLLTRREALAILGASGAFSLLATRVGAEGRPSSLDIAPSCLLIPQQTEGPFFVEEGLNRSDIRKDLGSGAVKPGIPFILTLQIGRLSGKRCKPLANAKVDIWHCDAAGRYSDVADQSFSTKGENYLRGYQLTDAAGMARFSTIFPGWYEYRTVHIHFKIRVGSSASNFEFTSQLYFDDAFTDEVHAHAPYASRGPRRVRNKDDEIFADGGSQLMLAPTAMPNGFEARCAFGMKLEEKI